jgi:hypothetical protein
MDETTEDQSVSKPRLQQDDLYRFATETSYFAAQKSKLHFLIEPSQHPRAGAALSALAD